MLEICPLYQSTSARGSGNNTTQIHTPSLVDCWAKWPEVSRRHFLQILCTYFHRIFTEVCFLWSTDNKFLIISVNDVVHQTGTMRLFKSSMTQFIDACVRHTASMSLVHSLISDFALQFSWAKYTWLCLQTIRLYNRLSLTHYVLYQRENSVQICITKLCITGSLWGESTCGFPSQRASKKKQHCAMRKIIYISWRHHYALKCFWISGSGDENTVVLFYFILSYSISFHFIGVRS